jgi:hypothetical protein
MLRLRNTFHFLRDQIRISSIGATCQQQANNSFLLACIADSEAVYLPAMIRSRHQFPSTISAEASRIIANLMDGTADRSRNQAALLSMACMELPRPALRLHGFRSIRKDAVVEKHLLLLKRRVQLRGPNRLNDFVFGCHFGRLRLNSASRLKFRAHVGDGAAVPQGDRCGTEERRACD